MWPEGQTAALDDVVPVILAGGAGTRLWPLTGSRRPKASLALPGGCNFLQNTAARLTGLRPPYVLCATAQRAAVSTQIQAAQIILEPAGRGTAPAVAAAAHYLSRDADPLLLVLPCDHAIADAAPLQAAVARAVPLARDGWLVSFVVPARRAASRFGHILPGTPLPGDAFRIASFREKPGRAVARQMLAAGGCFWNTGIFLFSARSYLEALRLAQPAIHAQSLAALKGASRLQNSILLAEDHFRACPALSIDYAVMESTQAGAVMPVAMAWRDLGTWPSYAIAMMAAVCARQERRKQT